MVLVSAEELCRVLYDAPLDVRAKAETLVGQLRGMVRNDRTRRREGNDRAVSKHTESTQATRAPDESARR